MGLFDPLLGLVDQLVPFAFGVIPSFVPGVPGLIREAIPLAAQIAPFALPGLGGIAASAGLSLLASNNQNPLQRAGAAAVMARQQCPPMGVPRGGFSRPFQSAFFSSGGSLPGRGMQASFVGGTAIGRPSAGCPPKGGITRFAQPIRPGPKPVGGFAGQFGTGTAVGRILGGLQEQIAGTLTPVGAPGVAGVAPTFPRISFGRTGGFGGF